jgi:protein-S-isoprenylcysteine O-methyltransferase Ste14
MIIIKEKERIVGRLGKMNFQKLLPPVWFLLSIIVMIGLHFWLPIKQLLFPPVTYLGIIAIAMGIVTISFCSYLFRQKNTTIKPFLESSYLIREGFFNYSRNPIYLAMIITLIGVWIVLGSLTPVLIIPIFTWLIQEMFIIEEEKMLEATFGEEYREYKASVRRWV